MTTDRRPDLAQLVLRLFAAPIFLTAGFQHLAAPAVVARRLAEGPHADLVLRFASAETLVLLSGAALAAGGVAVLAGLFTRLAAVGLLAVLVPITLTVQVGASSTGPLMKNVAIAGVLLHLAMVGAGRFALDAVLARGRSRAVAAAAAAALLATALPARAEAPPEARRVVVLVQQPQQLEAAIASAAQLLAGTPVRASEVRIIACGGATDALLRGAPGEREITAAAQRGIALSACGLTLKSRKIAPERLNPAVSVVPNGILEAVRLQAEGWLSVEL